jgi:hypothetical protein
MLELHPDWLPEGVRPDDVTGVLAAHGYDWSEITADAGTRNLLCHPRSA